jgi:hypothetical protein
MHMLSTEIHQLQVAVCVGLIVFSTCYTRIFIVIFAI